MLTATLLALGAAVLHAGWNLAVQQSGDRFIALWGQFATFGAVSLVVVLSAGGLPDGAWRWALLSGALHVPYAWFLARAYDHGDFSLVYPLARGGGALLAALGGVLLLDDDLGWARGAGVMVVAAGLFLLAGHLRGPGVVAASVVALSIGAYSLADAQGVRSSDAPLYVLATFGCAGMTLTVAALLLGRRQAMVDALRTDGLRYTAIGAVSALTYGMVQWAFRLAPVGYVTALRESSVLIAAVAGSRILGEADARRRAVAAAVMMSGLVLLVVAS